MKEHPNLRRGILPGVAALCLPVAAALVFPSAAMAATTGGSTVRAVVGGDGAVKSVKVYGANGQSSAFDGALPLKLGISRSVSGNATTYTYEVDNTFSKTQDVTYTDTAGKSHTVSSTLQLPLVAQLGVVLPKSFTNVSAPSGVVMTEPDGTNRVLYNMVLFSPLGSPTQSVSFTVNGTGVPTAELAAQVVDPSTTQGVASASQAATADSQQDDFWTSFASGGNGGLTQLSTGMGQIVAGLTQLHDGLVTAVGGANQLDAGTKAADVGSHKLSSGLGLIHSGLESLTGGVSKIHTGQGALTTGLSQIHTGQSQLTGGLGQISGGLNQLADATTGLPAASAGVTQLIAGMNALIAGVGDDATANTLVNGVDLAIGGVNQLYAGIKASSACAVDALTVVLGGTAGIAPNADPCIPTGLAPATGLSAITTAAATSSDASITALATSLGQWAAVLTNMKNQFAAVAAGTDGVLNVGIAQLVGGLQAIHNGLTHPVGTNGPSDLGGVAQGLAAVNAGLTAVGAGLTAANTGVSALAAGAQQALAGSQALETGSASALAGSQALTTGSGQALTGSQQLTSGSGSALTGSQQLASGLDKLSAGQHQVAAGLPTAVSGTKQLLDGSVQVKDGIGAVQSGAVGPLTKQLSDGSLNAKKSLAILAATAGLGSQAPGGAGTSYVLTQNPNGITLAANTTAAKSSDNTGRNVGIGLGAFAALIVATVAGFALGRRSGATISA